MSSTFMNSMMSQMQTSLGGIPVSSGFMNYSGMFRNMTSHQYFWNYSGGRMTPGTGMMGGSGMH
jgi:NADH:ubiquinone oxidoreductase subunit 2 (subunit N)